MGNADSTPEAVAVWQAAKGGDVTKLQALYNEHRSEQPDILSATPTQVHSQHSPKWHGGYTM